MTGGFKIYDNTLKDTKGPALISSTRSLGGQSSGQKFILYHTNYLIMTDRRAQGGIHVVDISNEKAPTEALWYDNGTGYLDIDYDESSEILYGFQSSTKSIVQIDVSDLNRLACYVRYNKIAVRCSAKNFRPQWN